MKIDENGIPTINIEGQEITLTRVRVERGGGSGAMSCCEGREAGEHQDGAEESREDLPRCAGEVNGEDEKLARRLEEEAAHAENTRQWLIDQGSTNGNRLRMCLVRAAAYRRAAALLSDDPTAPEPDSEAPKERSGRRNPTRQEPEGLPAQDCYNKNKDQ